MLKKTGTFCVTFPFFHYLVIFPQLQWASKLVSKTQQIKQENRAPSRLVTRKKSVIPNVDRILFIQTRKWSVGHNAKMLHNGQEVYFACIVASCTWHVALVILSLMDIILSSQLWFEESCHVVKEPLTMVSKFEMFIMRLRLVPTKLDQKLSKFDISNAKAQTSSLEKKLNLSFSSFCKFCIYSSIQMREQDSKRHITQLTPFPQR